MFTIVGEGGGGGLVTRCSYQTSPTITVIKCLFSFEV